MKSGLGHRPPWFAILRRDRGLFAFAASLLVLTHLFQPLAQAHAAANANAWVICTALGMEMPSSPGDQPRGECPDCISALAWLSKLTVPPAEPTTFVLPARVAGNLVFAPFAGFAPSSTSKPPPAIRAPPFAA